MSERSTTTTTISRRNEKPDSAAGSTHNSVNDDLIRLVREAERNSLTTKIRACSDLTDTSKLLSGDRPDLVMNQDNSQSLAISQKHSALDKTVQLSKLVDTICPPSAVVVKRHSPVIIKGQSDVTKMSQS